MIKNFLVIFFLFAAQLCVAQTFNFETSTHSDSWVADKGTLSVSTDHFKDGEKSLKWETSGASVLTVTFNGFSTTNTNSAVLFIYCKEQTNDTLKVEFLNNSSVKRSATFLCNYIGWRDFNRAYTEYASTQATLLNGVRFTLKPTSTNIRSIYFDDVKFNTTNEAKRIVGHQWKLDNVYFVGSKTQIEL
jgi:chondroitin-sulfate-ABC endolyase/exolyase